MTIAASSILQRCVDTLQDTTSVRWPVPELVRYLNDGQREVVLYRPDAMVTTSNFACAAGSKQELDKNNNSLGAAKLIEITRNVNTAESHYGAVRLVNREILDAQKPDWHNETKSGDIAHYMYDPRNPLEFYVYPPAKTTAVLEVVYSKYPEDIDEPASNANVSSVVGNISVPDIYSNVIQDYILYRAYSKDSEYAGNAQRAQAHYAAFANALGIEIQATVQVAPNPVSNPNVPQRVTA